MTADDTKIDKTFYLGFEAGRFSKTLEENKNEIRGDYHKENKELFLRMVSGYGYEVINTKDCDNTYFSITVRKQNAN